MRKILVVVSLLAAIAAVALFAPRFLHAQESSDADWPMMKGQRAAATMQDCPMMKGQRAAATMQDWPMYDCPMMGMTGHSDTAPEEQNI